MLSDEYPAVYQQLHEKGPGSNGTTLSHLGTNELLPTGRQMRPFLTSWSSQEWQILAASFECARLYATGSNRQSQLGDADQKSVERPTDEGAFAETQTTLKGTQLLQSALETELARQ